MTAAAPRFAFTFEPSTDYDLIRSIFVHPRLYGRLGDDYSPAPADYRPPAPMIPLTMDPPAPMAAGTIAAAAGINVSYDGLLIPSRI